MSKNSGFTFGLQKYEQIYHLKKLCMFD